MGFAFKLSNRRVVYSALLLVSIGKFFGLKFTESLFSCHKDYI